MVGFIFAKDVVVGMTAFERDGFPVDILAKQTRQRPSNCRFVLRAACCKRFLACAVSSPRRGCWWTFPTRWFPQSFQSILRSGQWQNVTDTVDSHPHDQAKRGKVSFGCRVRRRQGADDWSFAPFAAPIGYGRTFQVRPAVGQKALRAARRSSSWAQHQIRICMSKLE